MEQMMAEYLEPADDAAARATRKMMQRIKQPPAGGLVIDPAGLQATIATLYIMSLTSLSFWIEQGVPVESVCRRLDKGLRNLSGGAGGSGYVIITEYLKK
jgi:hypothetical protein